MFTFFASFKRIPALNHQTKERSAPKTLELAAHFWWSQSPPEKLHPRTSSDPKPQTSMDLEETRNVGAGCAHDAFNQKNMEHHGTPPWHPDTLIFFHMEPQQPWVWKMKPTCKPRKRIISMNWEGKWLGNTRPNWWFFAPWKIWGCHWGISSHFYGCKSYLKPPTRWVSIKYSEMNSSKLWSVLWLFLGWTSK